MKNIVHIQWINSILIPHIRKLEISSKLLTQQVQKYLNYKYLNKI